MLVSAISVALLATSIAGPDLPTFGHVSAGKMLLLSIGAGALASRATAQPAADDKLLGADGDDKLYGEGGNDDVTPGLELTVCLDRDSPTHSREWPSACARAMTSGQRS